MLGVSEDNYTIQLRMTYIRSTYLIVQIYHMDILKLRSSCLQRVINPIANRIIH